MLGFQLFFEFGLDSSELTLLPCGIEAGVLFGHDGTGLFFELCHHFLHGLDLVGVSAGEVVGLPDVLDEIVEFEAAVFVVFDELPVSHADHCNGFSALVSIVWVVPEEGTFGDALAFQKWFEGDAIDVFFGEEVEAGEVEQGGVEVGPCDRGVALGAGVGEPGNPDVEGSADSAFPLAPFATAIGEGCGCEGIATGHAAIITSEDDDGVVLEILRLHGGEDSPDSFIHRFHHAGVDGAILHDAHRQGAVVDEAFFGESALSRLLLILCPEFLGGFDRGVDGVEGEVG